MASVLLKKLSKSFGRVIAVNELSFEIADGEFFSLLGPSGCGKTTTLRMIAGFETPTAGQIYFGDRDVTFLKPNRRNTGMVFQNFALFPHLSVFDNVAFGLRARKTPGVEISVRVRKALELVALAGLEERKVTELSGGQQQRVALARAVVIEPDILLLDEPLSNLDAKLREETRKEIRELQQRLGITTIYVTHDQDEALSLSDRMAVLDQGVCLQVGAPDEVYRFPQNEFVARFVGNSNVFPGRISPTQPNRVEVGDDLLFAFVPEITGPFRPGLEVKVGIRPESIEIAEDESPADGTCVGTIEQVQFSGAVAQYVVKIRELRLRIKHLVSERDFSRKTGERIKFRVPATQVRIFNP